MPIPPERISIKRRRQEEPVETLVLEQATAHSQKRRYTDFFFQRVQHEEAAPNLPLLQRTQETDAGESKPRANYSALGVPVIKATEPGDEVKDFARYRLSNRPSRNKTDRETPGQTSEPATGLQKSLQLPTANARRFHLTRNLSSVLKASPAGGIRRRHRNNIRPPLATFVERRHLLPENDRGSSRQPIDRIIEADAKAGRHSKEELRASRKTQVNTFVRSSKPVARHGHSRHDDPSTWDHDSDELANQLAALAFELDPDGNVGMPAVPPTLPSPARDAVHMESDDDYVYETYIRVQHDESLATVNANECGVLVIDAEDEDLWEKYIGSDEEDDDWDEEEEDSNAEDNPRNDYPEDEISSDDSPYRYRHGASDDEFDLDHDRQ